MAENMRDPDSYVLARTKEEEKRLDAQSDLFREPLMKIFNKISLRKGMSCLDVGCGTGAAMRLMAGFVGENGIVTGIDIDGKLGRETVKKLKAANTGDFRFIEGNVEDPSFDIPGTYDVVFARLLLLHLDDPVSALKRMWQWTKPGGYLVVQDRDACSLRCYPPLEQEEEIWRVFFGVLKNRGRDPDIGHKLPSYFEQAGIGPPDGTDLYAFLRKLEDVRDWVLGSYRAYLPAALKLGLTTEEKGREFCDIIRNAKGSHYVQSYTMVSLWKKKPK